MKKIVLIIFAMAVVTIAAHELAMSKPVSNITVPEFAWTDTQHNFGKIKMGSPVTHEFTFTNKGDAPLVVSAVKASCGCTVTDFTKDPINPGQQGYVLARYDASKVGVFTKTVSVMSNTDEIVVLTIQGEVVD